MKLINWDCLEEMDKIQDKSIDMILCDLPYWTTQNKADIILPFDLLWKHYERIIKDNWAIILFWQWLFFIDLINSNRKLFRYDLVWNKELTTWFLNAKRMPLRQHEQIAVFYKKLPVYNPQFKQWKPLHWRGKSYLEKENINNNYWDFRQLEDTRKWDTNKYPTSILTYSKPHPSKALHRTEKPVELLQELILTYSNEWDLILDNCMWAWSCWVACKNTNRDFIWIELDENYFKIAEERINSLT